MKQFVEEVAKIIWYSMVTGGAVLLLGGAVLLFGAELLRPWIRYGLALVGSGLGLYLLGQGTVMLLHRR